MTSKPRFSFFSHFPDEKPVPTLSGNVVTISPSLTTRRNDTALGSKRRKLSNASIVEGLEMRINSFYMVETAADRIRWHGVLCCLKSGESSGRLGYRSLQSRHSSALFTSGLTSREFTRFCAKITGWRIGL